MVIINNKLELMSVVQLAKCKSSINGIWVNTIFNYIDHILLCFESYCVELYMKIKMLCVDS